jgi:hypothetical protein
VQNIPAEIVDWILVELRSDSSVSSAAARRAAFLKTDGSVVDLDGFSPLIFRGVKRDNYFITIRHRNHLEVISASKVFLSETTAYDFTISPSKALGSDLADLGEGKYGMYAGDGDANGVINILDFELVGKNLFRSGYFNGDLDLNGIINLLDYGLTNHNLLKSSRRN